MKINTKLRILEFVLAGILMDLAENAITIKLTTGESLTYEMLFIALAVVVPFAVLTEVIIDHPQFWPRLLSFFNIRHA